MFTDPISIAILSTTTVSTVVAVVIALKWKVRESAALVAMQSAQHDADESRTALESAKIHGCIDRTRRRQVEAVFEVLRDSVIVIDAHGEVLHANACASGLLSVPPNEAAGKKLEDIVKACQVVVDAGWPQVNQNDVVAFITPI